MSGDSNLDSGGGNTGSGSGPSSTNLWSIAEGFVYGRNVDWAGVARTLISSLILLVTAGYIWFWEAVWRQPARFIRGTFEWMYQALARPFDLAAGHFWLAWETATAALPMAELGPFSFPVAVLVIATTFWVSYVLFKRVVLGVFA